MRLALRAWALRRAAPARGLSSQQRETEQERTIREKLLRDPHLEPQEVVVQDTSGGCGDFFFIKVASKNFHGKRTIQQHNMVKEALQGDISNWHGYSLRTERFGEKSSS